MNKKNALQENKQNLTQIPPIDLKIRPLVGPPFGLDQAGRIIRDISGELVKLTIEYMQDVIARSDPKKSVQVARRHALDQLVALINASIQNPKYQVDSDYLLNPGNYYSFEFNLTLLQYAKAISGDANFFFDCGKHLVPQVALRLWRPLALEQVFRLIPQLANRFGHADLQVVHIQSNRAIIQWQPKQILDRLPEERWPEYYEVACQGYKGILSSVPVLHSNRPPATVRDLKCLLDGDDFCEWEFVWQPTQLHRNRWALVGTALTLALFVYTFLGGFGSSLIAFIAPLPLVLGMFVPLVHRLQFERDKLQSELIEQCQSTAEQYDTLQKAYADIQVCNLTLEERIQSRTQAIQAKKQRLDAALAHLVDGLIVVDAQGRIILTNPAFDRFIDQRNIDLTGCSLADIVSDIDLQTLIVHALAESKVFNDDITLNERIYRASANAMRLDEQVVGVVTLLHDITQDIAVDRLKTDFISMISQQLRAPLTSVLGFAKLVNRAFERNILPHLLADEPKVQRAADRVANNLQIIEEESQRLTRLINNVLDIAKLESGKIEWQEQQVDLNDVVQEAIAATSNLASQKGLSVVNLLQQVESPPTIWGDRERIVQVFIHLLNNAIKFTDVGQVRIRAEQRIFDGAPSVVCSVMDTGIGIPPSDLPKIFEKFKQSSDTLTDRPQGTGLGLAICKEIVGQHGGKIWAESELGAGSTISFSLSLSSLDRVVESKKD